jgi:2-aminoethylphosphonate dioxygenase
MYKPAQNKNIFKEYGYVCLRNFLGSKDIDQLDNSHRNLTENARYILQKASDSCLSLSQYYQQSSHALIVVPEQSKANEICRFEYICGLNKAIYTLILSKILPIIEDFMEEHYVLFKDKCNEKNPGGGAFTPHQDFTAYQIFEPRLFVTAMIPLDDASPENGCLQFASNYRQIAVDSPQFVKEWNSSYPLFFYYEDKSNNGDILVEICEKLKWEPVSTLRGDIVIFDSYVPHYSEPNRSRVSRRAMFFTFNAMRYGNLYELYYKHKRDEYDNPYFHVSTPTEHAFPQNRSDQLKRVYDEQNNN